MAVKIKYLTVNAEVEEIEVKGGLLEGLQYVQRIGIKGAKANAHGEWIDVDSFMENGHKMFGPVDDEYEYPCNQRGISLEEK